LKPPVQQRGAEKWASSSVADRR